MLAKLDEAGRQETVASPDAALPTSQYFRTLHNLVAGAEVTDGAGQAISLSEGLGRFMQLAGRLPSIGNKLMFIGNGGSAGISSHMAIDLTKNGNIPALAFNDGAALTCLSNDLGYEQVFAHQIKMHARAGDLVVAISSSGRSRNILAAVEAARAVGCDVITLSGFGGDNPLRAVGDVNFYVGSSEYGFVEVGHLALIHAALDMLLGWRG